MTGLTKKQGELLAFLKSYIAEHGGTAPSYAEMCVALDLRSKSGVNRLMNGLVERGVVRRVPNRARAIEVVEEPGVNLLLVPSLEAALNQYCAAAGVAPRYVVAVALKQYFETHPLKEKA